MKKIFREVIIRLLYLTPFGYLFSFIELSNKLAELNYKEKKGSIGLSAGRNGPISIEIKKSPSLGDRLYWFFNGCFLIVQTWFILTHSIDNFAGSYAVLTTIFGSASVVSAFYPRLPWNKKLF